jgi:hypothetical protein
LWLRPHHDIAGRMAPPLIQLKDIALTFGGRPLLEGVELSVSASERVAWSAATARTSPPSSSIP